MYRWGFSLDGCWIGFVRTALALLLWWSACFSLWRVLEFTLIQVYSQFTRLLLYWLLVRLQEIVEPLVLSSVGGYEDDSLLVLDYHAPSLCL